MESDGAVASESAPEAQTDEAVESRDDHSELQRSVHGLQALLKNGLQDSQDLLVALEQLRLLGPLPTKVLSATGIGKTVNEVSKGAKVPEEARAKARDIVEGWRQLHRKRKASSTGDLLRRSTSSQGDEATQGSEAAVSPSHQLQNLQETSAVSSSLLPPVERVNSTASMAESLPESQEDKLASKEKTEYRDKVRQKLLEALGKEEEIEAKGNSDRDALGLERMRDPVTLANEIEEALNAALPKKEAYMNQARSILYNLKDSKNHSFRFKLMVGFFRANQVPGLSAEDMASDEKNAERAKQRKFAMEEIQSDWALKNGQQRITGMFTCGKCKGVKTTYFQMQTRSSDEPMTTFVTCLTCNNRWKFC